MRRIPNSEYEPVVKDTVDLVEKLNDMGYVIGFGSVVIKPDALVLFWVEGPGVTFVYDLADLGFMHRYELRSGGEARHPILPRD